MKILSILGSMRKERYTHRVMDYFVNALMQEDETIQNEVIYISDMTVSSCKVECASFCRSSNYKCSIDDDFDSILNKMIDADLVILGAPLYFRIPPADFHTFAERLTAVFFNIECDKTNTFVSPLKNKPCVLIGVAEYSSPTLVLDYLYDLANILHMTTIKLDSFPYIGLGGQGNIDDDVVFKPMENALEMAKLVLNNKRFNNSGLA